MNKNTLLATLVLSFGICTTAFAGLSEGKAALEKEDYAAAEKEFWPLAEKGDPEAQFGMGQVKRNGDKVYLTDVTAKGRVIGLDTIPMNNYEAVKWYLKAAKQGHPGAQNVLGYMYAKGLGVTKNSTQAFKWYQQSADSGDLMGITNVGHHYFVEKNYEEAMKCYRKAADKNFAEAQFYVASLYLKGWGVSQNYAEALQWGQKAAGQNFPAAYTLVSYVYAEGLGVTRSYKESAKWLHKAAEQGEVEAQSTLGDMYKDGNGVTQSYKEAMKWYLKAADKGDESAMKNISDMYKNGLGVAKDADEELKWRRQKWLYLSMKKAESGAEEASKELIHTIIKAAGMEKEYGLE